MNRDAESRATARKSPSQIMQRPGRHMSGKSASSRPFIRENAVIALRPFTVSTKLEPSILGTL